MNDKAMAWIVGNDTGSSSKLIWKVMMGHEPDRWKSYPSDAGDLGRCLRLLAMVPEWKGRMSDLAAVSPYWAALVKNWPRLEAAMAEETGPDFDRNKSAPHTYKLMKQILDPIESKDSRIIRLGSGASIRF
ncbi:MAG: hypothetical protein EOR57_31680 [Mesorhizobium sp.]|uniref:hypothetical protein n=1 Tax=Mesorhizobium sp. TaxID=1871066 RepID=UPI000FE4696F|nr:hypothetical protein [Mesorhizobium sp.]RWL14909.1 MAG: hypothetical protein EOR57_31680 [Mesorhizobium sp.]